MALGSGASVVITLFMKKILLSIICSILLPAAALADQIVVTFAGAKYTGTVEKIVPFSEGSSTTSINNQTFEVDDVFSFVLMKDGTGVADSYINPAGSNPHMMWAKSTTMVVTPKNGITLNKIEMYCTTANYTGTLTCNDGTCSKATKLSSWTGDASYELYFSYTNEAKYTMRIMYMIIDYTVKSSAIDDIVADGISVDAEAPVEYYNLLGTRIDTPRKGNIYIRRQGNKTSKVIF